ncbi:MAG: hypothetical protein S4CHLAM45_10640 [Chlamydiales bacterium]|nr:hypothetical protein [Chlamydiales bacterium]MCH9619557.1 hypothetical protein [Chlamydiales bacterium]MCH9623163.1 hypothetical protein [Chlamydiales bacterium]
MLFSTGFFMKRLLLFFLFFPLSILFGQVKVGIDVLFEKEYAHLLKGKRIGLITNMTAIDAGGISTVERLRNNNLVAIFAPEHGFYGSAYSSESISDEMHGEIPIYSLHGKSRRPAEEHLKDIDLLIFDIQDIGCRSYSYIGTLFYCMEEAAKRKIPFIVLDRPNPLGGMVVDGPLVDENCRSFISYVNIPYCHGMTIGELALFFNNEYKVGCTLTVVPMEGWKRGMVFTQTGLNWVPTSPQIPEPDTAFFYPTTGVIGEYSFVNIGVGYTLPFKVVGAPWIDAEKLTKTLNDQNLPGVHFQPFFFRPFFGKYKQETCKGSLIIVTDANTFLPISTQYTIIGVLKGLYPRHFEDAMKQIQASCSKKQMCHKLNGREEIHHILSKEKYVIWKLREICRKDREKFLPIRKKYLNDKYSDLN